MSKTSQHVSNQQRTEDPDITLGLTGLLIGFMLMPPVGLVLSIIANRRSRAAGYKNTFASAGIWISAIFTLLVVLLIVLLVATSPPPTTQTM